MRTIFAIAVASAALVSTAALASEPAPPPVSHGSYCLKIYGDAEKDCSFTSLAECNASASGLSADCYAAEPQGQEFGPYAQYRQGAGASSSRSDRPNEPR